jgi:hypothetical protein
MPYTIIKSDGNLFLTLEDGQLDVNSTSITLVGKNVINYGQYENTNLIRILENFANTSSPPFPLTGQLWFDKTADILRLNVFNGTNWIGVPNFIYSTSTTSLSPGDFWFKADSQELYIRSTSSNILIGGAGASSVSSDKLTTARTINGVPFDGTTNITISSTITNSLVVGDYLLGNDFNGNISTTISVDVGTVTSPDPLKVVARDSSGDIWFTVGHGIATSSRYADLAEKYLSDKSYEIGTVMSIGGELEVTACTIGDRAIGVISENPALMMNSDLEGGTYVALKGRVPVKVTGKVSKKDFLIAGPNGTAIATSTRDLFIFGIALEDNNGSDIVEAIII